VNCNVVGAETAKYRTFELPPPGGGFDTVMEAVLAVAMFEAGTVAVNCELLTNVVVSAVPFHSTTDPETNPVPFTVSLKLWPPGAVAVGTRGWLTKGTGFVCAKTVVMARSTNGQTKRADFMGPSTNPRFQAIRASAAYSSAYNTRFKA
jgi:hypothetical protein